jgi:hypothetical protein
VARLLAGLFRRGRNLGTSLGLAWVNGQPGAVGYDAEGRVFTVFELAVADGVVHTIRASARRGYSDGPRTPVRWRAQRRPRPEPDLTSYQPTRCPSPHQSLHPRG